MLCYGAKCKLDRKENHLNFNKLGPRSVAAGAVCARYSMEGGGGGAGCSAATWDHSLKMLDYGGFTRPHFFFAPRSDSRAETKDFFFFQSDLPPTHCCTEWCGLI